MSEINCRKELIIINKKYIFNFSLTKKKKKKLF